MSTEAHTCDRKGSPAKVADEFYPTCSVCGEPQVFELHPEHSNSLEVALQWLAELNDTALPSAKAMLEADGSNMFGLDLLALAAIKRSMALTAGFRAMLTARNLTCAGALVRLELDTALRFFAAWLVHEPHQFAIDVLAGKRIRAMKDRDGKLLTDRYLVERLSEQYGWVPRVYERTSGYVHFSSTHVMSVMRDASEAEGKRTLSFLVGVEDKPLPDSIYIETCDGFRACAEILLRYVDGWASTKANPHLLKL
jgi:hypothetical protein